MARIKPQISLHSLIPEPPVAAIRVCRQSVEADVPRVQALQTPATQAVFGDVDVKQCIEKRVCKTLLNADDEVVAFLVVMDHPNIVSIAFCNWVGWIRRFYRIDFASPWNTYFIHYLVWDSRYKDFFLPLLKTLYKNNPKLEQVLMITPPRISMFPELEHVFTLVYPTYEMMSGSVINQFQNLHVNLRHRVLSKLTVRRAAEEDNIDVQPLLHHQLDVLRYVYGEFRLGNVIDLKCPNKAILVAEKTDSVTVGVLTASNKVNYDEINSFFHHVLDPSRRDSYGTDRLVRVDTVRSEFRRGLPFTPETMSTEEQISIDLNLDNKFQSEDEDSFDEDEERDELVVYWDEDGDMFRVVDPVMEYLLHAKQKKKGPEMEIMENSREDSGSSDQTVDFTYWGHPSWSNSIVPVNQEESRERVGTGGVVTKDQTLNIVFTPVENAFMITLFALHPDLDVRYAYDLLEASFECFNDRHFCLLSLPTAYQGSPLTQHMVRMAPKMSWDFPHELYVTHRNAVFSTFSVRPVTVVDHVGIHELVENISQGKKISKDITKIFLKESPGTKGFVLECEGNIVGVAVLTINYGLNQLQPHFHLERLINIKLYDQECHGLIRHIVLCPIFLKSGPFFLRQIMHQLGLETLNYCLFHDDIINLFHIDVSPITVLGDMTPVQPRRRIEYDLSALDDFKPQDYVIHGDHDFALFITTEKLLSIQKLELNYRIIVVGGSDTAMSFLEHLIFYSAQKHIIYSNLVLVSVHGFPLELRPHSAGDKMVPHGGVYTRDYLSRISLSTHVNVLYGALTVIKRNKKMIRINEDHWLRYDYLFLTTGLQFCKPWPSLETRTVKHGSIGQNESCATDSDSCLKDDRDIPQEDCKKNEDIRELYTKATEHYAENLFVINTSADAVIVLSHLKKYFKHSKKEGKILIYGNGLNMCTCVESLLVFGVPGCKIALVIAPHPIPGHNCLENNPFVEKTIVQTVEEAGVTIYRGFSLICWSLRHKHLEKVMFRDNDNIPMTLDCVALICYGNKSTNAKTYLAVSDAGIVYNNGIIIDNKFRTNDEFIYAAGPGTRYSNRYYPAQYVHHKYYNSVEIGKVMSETIRRLLEPNTELYTDRKTSTKPSQEEADLFSINSDLPDPPPPFEVLPQLTTPITLVAKLPGGWNYVKVSTPGLPIPLECQFNGQGDSGPILITGVPILPDGPGYFQLSFSVYNTVREIVLLSKKDIPYGNLSCLYGKHERLLNSLYEQYNQGMINDLYAFFSQPWAYALYTSRFDELHRQCTDLFVTDESVGLPKLQDLKAHEVNSVLKRLRSGDQDAISSRYLSSSVPMYVEHLALKYISERQLQLPMYFTDAVLASWYQSTQSSSPLHRDPAKLRYKSKSSTPRTS